LKKKRLLLLLLVKLTSIFVFQKFFQGSSGTHIFRC